MSKIAAPWEVERELLVKAEEETDPRWGSKPEDRPIQDYVRFGVINLDKPSGPSSHEITAWTKRIIKVKKAGHGGTLDPKVTGVLPITLLDATKIVQALLLAGKEYVCVMKLHADVPENRLRQVLNEFEGKIYQRPPLRASVKHRVRTRIIYHLDYLEKQDKNVLLRVACQAGTYIRKLCVSGDTELFLSNGEIVKIEDFVSTFCQSAGSYDIAGDYRTISFDNGRQVNNRILKAQKFPSPTRLIKLKTASGIELKLTKDHEVLVSAVNGPKWVRAENLREGDLVFSPAELSIEENSPYIVDLLDDEFLVNGEGVRQKCILGFKEKYGSIRGMARKLGIDRKPFYRNSRIYIRIKYIKAACDWNKIKDEITRAKSERGRIVELKSKRLTKKIMYLLGLIASDGCLVSEKGRVRPSRIKFDNSEEELIRKFVNVHKQLFPSIPLHVKNVGNNLLEVDTNNPVLAGVAHSLGIKSPAKEADFKHVITLPERLIKSFLKGYFDGDGSACFHQKEKRCLTNINFYTINRVTAKRLYLLLKRVGIRSKIYSRKVSGSFKTKSERYNVVRLKSPCDKLKFIEEIGSNHPKKKETLRKMKKALKKSRAKKLEHSPLHVKEIIKKTLRENNLWIHDLNLGGNFWRVLNSDIPMTKYLLSRVVKKLERVVKEKALQPITSILNSAFCVERIKEVQEIKSTESYVYDITVENSHNLIPEGSIVVSNCHDVGEALGCGAHMRELRRTRSGPLTEQDSVTLHDIAYHYSEYRENGNEAHIHKIVKPMENALKYVPKIVIRDSAVAAVCHGANLTAPGILAVETGIEPKRTVAIFTQKGEAVALAKALASTNQLLEMDHGFAAKTERVLMPRNVYPKMWQTG